MAASPSAWIARAHLGVVDPALARRDDARLDGRQVLGEPAPAAGRRTRRSCRTGSRRGRRVWPSRLCEPRRERLAGDLRRIAARVVDGELLSHVGLRWPTGRGRRSSADARPEVAGRRIGGRGAVAGRAGGLAERRRADDAGGEEAGQRGLQRRRRSARGRRRRARAGRRRARCSARGRRRRTRRRARAPRSSPVARSRGRTPVTVSSPRISCDDVPWRTSIFGCSATRAR